MQHLEIWKFLAGLGFFLYGMSKLETVLKNASGRSLKLFLKRNTQSLFKSVTGGAFITGVIQSSSVVSLIVLAFVESRIITFRNALGVILGTNIGTTLTSWIFATVGFKLDVSNYSLPIIAITTILMFFFEKRRKLYNLLAIFFALGILFLGLGFMKEGALVLVEDLDLKRFNQYGTFVFVLIGFIITTIIQSSSATVAITLTAIYAGAITFPSAVALVIGAEIGTTIKILFWGMKGSADKKRVAWGNFIYNIFTGSMAFIFLNWFIYFIENIVRINDPLIGLVFFQTSINVLSMLFFIPFLNVFSKWLESKITDNASNGNSYISKDLPLLPVLATHTMRKETINLLKKTLQFIRNILCYKPQNEGLFENIKSFTHTNIDIEEKYNRLKQTEGDILGYYASIQGNNLREEDTTVILQYVSAVRRSIYAAKAIKDIAHNLKEFDASANDIIYEQIEFIRNEWIAFHNILEKLIDQPDKQKISSQIENLLSEAFKQEENLKSNVMQDLKNNHLNEVEASTIMNVHRELLSCKKSLLSSLGNIGTEHE